jgi:predicted peroxiredoxin
MQKINKVHSFWTHDGSILVKERENSKVKVIKNQSHVDKMELTTYNQCLSIRARVQCKHKHWYVSF